jgi:hypothetical protein
MELKYFLSNNCLGLLHFPGLIMDELLRVGECTYRVDAVVCFISSCLCLLLAYEQIFIGSKESDTSLDRFTQFITDDIFERSESGTLCFLSALMFVTI